MKRYFIPIIVIAYFAPFVHAQPGANDTPITTLLEKRVPEELAAEGLVLSRRNLSLRVEQVGEQLIVSLVDLSNGRVVASTKIDHIPADREAVIATVTHVVADLAGQAGAAPQMPVPVVVDDRVEREQRQLAEMKFQRERVHFDHAYELTGTGRTASLHRKWIALRGEQDEELSPKQFYELVGRPELVNEYNRRTTIMQTSGGLGLLALVGGTVALTMGVMNNRPDYEHCLGASDFMGCTNAEDQRVADARQPYYIAAGVGIGLGIIGVFVSGYYLLNRHPISEAAAKELADGYNQGLRHQLGLPAVARRSRPVIHDVQVVPYATGHDYGVALTARF
jgi:hypothetical protein